MTPSGVLPYLRHQEPLRISNSINFAEQHFMMRQLLLWGSQNPWLSQKLPRYRFVQRAVRRFIPGEELVV